MSNDKITQACTLMRNAMKGAGTNEKVLIEQTSSFSHKDRMKIRDAYKSLYGQDFMEDLENDLSGDFRTLMKGLYTDPVEFDAECLYNAMKGAGTKEDILTEIIASRPGWYMKKVSDKYLEKYKTSLEKDIEKDTSGDFRRCLIAIITGNRSVEQSPEREKCIQIANNLYQAGEKKMGTDEDAFLRSLANNSPAELAIICREYHKVSKKKTLMEAIESEFSGDIKNLLQEILYSQISPSEYFATKIKKAIKGAGTRELDLTRIIISRNEVDMPVIKKFYKLLYKSDLSQDVKSDVSGDYGKLLMAIIDK